MTAKVYLTNYVLAHCSKRVVHQQHLTCLKSGNRKNISKELFNISNQQKFILRGIGQTNRFNTFMATKVS